VAAFLPLLCLIPVFRLTVAPGADMAMHVALARALWAGAQELSPAWPGVAPLAYPRGFSGLVALFWGLGPARAGLLASALAYVLYALGARRLFAALDLRRPATLAALALLLAKAPQDVFAWGGNPTVLALALALHAAAIVAAASPPDWPRAALGAGLLLAGAAAVHPMGALIGALVVPPSSPWRRRGASSRRRAGGSPVASRSRSWRSARCWPRSPRFPGWAASCIRSGSCPCSRSRPHRSSTHPSRDCVRWPPSVWPGC
jgi:hypothetical protein